MPRTSGKEGAYKKNQLDKIKKELEEIQLKGEDLIIFIAEKLRQELINQGYQMTSVNDAEFIQIWKHEGFQIRVEICGQQIGGHWHE